MYLLGMARGVGSVTTSVWIFKWNWFYKLCFRNSEEGQRLSLGGYFVVVVVVLGVDLRLHSWF